ncbi:hypothetical protein A4T39_04755 [Enterobacter hormaechei]|nr:hypothetical protein AM444_06415 [Enterobacter cloacae complex sp.]KLW73250.1 hypothetical protein SK60_00953 [Enterobacter sp. BIDMC99]ORD28239.1 hypothetical protein A4T39_04755 [Enterobacter hormaechei]DAH85222.1 MAG TPA: hypothetical protein [Caudoviricetes sp.]CZZ32005.1 Uncharacterised protein [Enterobacter hormaechei]
MRIVECHISQIKPGETVEHEGQLRTVSKRNIGWTEFFGTSLFGDNYQLGTLKVRKVIFQKWYQGVVVSN